MGQGQGWKVLEVQRGKGGRKSERKKDQAVVAKGMDSSDFLAARYLRKPATLRKMAVPTTMAPTTETVAMHPSRHQRSSSTSEEVKAQVSEP